MTTRTKRKPSDGGRRGPPVKPAPLVGYRIELRRSDQLTVAVLLGAAILLVGLYWLHLSGWGTRPIEIDRMPQHRLDYQIDPNRANWVEWVQLPGIGEVLAKRIVEDREQNGPFRSIDELERVRGIGPKTIAGIAPYLRDLPRQQSSPPAPSELRED